MLLPLAWRSERLAELRSRRLLGCVAGPPLAPPLAPRFPAVLGFAELLPGVSAEEMLEGGGVRGRNVAAPMEALRRCGTVCLLGAAGVPAGGDGSLESLQWSAAPLGRRGGGHRCACRPEPGQQRLALPQTGSKRTRLLPPPFLAALQQVASQAVKARPPSFSMGTFQGTPSSFSPMAAPGSAASPGSSAFPNLPGRGVGFSECSEGGWGGSGQPS